MTRRFALSREEVLTTAVAVVVSTAAYLAGGSDYLARGVVGDLVGLAILSAVAVVRRRRLRHEALLCLACIGAVVALSPDWPPRVLPEAAWWAVFVVALSGYLLLRRRVCD